MLKSMQLRGWEHEYLVKWKGYHPIKASWVNESNMEHAQEAIKEFHNRLANKQKKHRTWWGHHLSFSGARDYTNVPHQVASEIKVKDFQEVTSWTYRVWLKKVVKWHGKMELSYVSQNQIQTPTLGLRETKRGGKQGELARKRTCLKCIPKVWLVVAASVGSHHPVRVL
jgi:hypothetical protein